MSHSGRRLSQRNRLDHPVEAELHLCRGSAIDGWIVDEQDDGVGMMFGGEDVSRLNEHGECCLKAPVSLWLADDEREGRPIPVTLAHITPVKQSDRTCRAGLSFDVSRMQPQDITHLLGVWRRLVVAAQRRR